MHPGNRKIAGVFLWLFSNAGHIALLVNFVV